MKEEILEPRTGEAALQGRPIQPMGPKLFRWAVTVAIVVPVLWSATGLEISVDRILSAPSDIWAILRQLVPDLSAEERDLMAFAGIRESTQKGLEHLGGKGCPGEVVEKEERSRAKHCHVIHAVGHQVLPHPIMPAQGRVEHNLGSEAVAGGHKGLLPLVREREEAAEVAGVSDDFVAEGGANARPESFQSGLHTVDVDACVFIG